ncbi:MAG TPA: 50S ribosomal protein L23 [Anaerolineae bacterium]|nr:50S ribosomal protein L23 [Anaerolineae bacterium]
MHLHEVLKRPLITEKTTYLRDLNQYAFEVDARANKNLVKQAVEEIFKVNVVTVRVINQPAKRRRYMRSRQIGKKAKQAIRHPGWKKAVVQLAANQRIELFEGV